MKIKFTSLIKSNEEEKKIEFETFANIYKENGFKIYEFKDLEQQINRFQIEDNKTIKKINIFRGINSIFLELNKFTSFNYQTLESYKIVFYTFLNEINFKENNIFFKYNLFQAPDLEKSISECKISVQILENR